MSITDLTAVFPSDVVTIGFGQTSYSVLEGSFVNVNIGANRAFERGPFIVTVASSDATAQCKMERKCITLNLIHHVHIIIYSSASSDYTAINQQLTFSSQSTVQNVRVSASADGIFDPNEVFNLILSSNQVLISAPSSIQITIEDVAGIFVKQFFFLIKFNVFMLY